MKGLNYGLTLINKETWGNIYKPKEKIIPLLNIDPMDLLNSPDFTFLYGVKVKRLYGSNTLCKTTGVKTRQPGIIKLFLPNDRFLCLRIN